MLTPNPLRSGYGYAILQLEALMYGLEGPSRAILAIFAPDFKEILQDLCSFGFEQAAFGREGMV